jgi:hypothetical protein
MQIDLRGRTQKLSAPESGNFQSNSFLTQYAARIITQRWVEPRTPKAKDISQQNPNFQVRPVFSIFTSIPVLIGRFMGDSYFRGDKGWGVPPRFSAKGWGVPPDF